MKGINNAFSVTKTFRMYLNKNSSIFNKGEIVNIKKLLDDTIKIINKNEDLTDSYKSFIEYKINDDYNELLNSLKRDTMILNMETISIENIKSFLDDVDWDKYNENVENSFHKMLEFAFKSTKRIDMSIIEKQIRRFIGSRIYNGFSIDKIISILDDIDNKLKNNRFRVVNLDLILGVFKKLNLSSFKMSYYVAVPLNIMAKDKQKSKINEIVSVEGVICCTYSEIEKRITDIRNVKTKHYNKDCLYFVIKVDDSKDEYAAAYKSIWFKVRWIIATLNVNNILVYTWDEMPSIVFWDINQNRISKDEVNISVPYFNKGSLSINTITSSGNENAKDLFKLIRSGIFNEKTKRLKNILVIDQKLTHSKYPNEALLLSQRLIEQCVKFKFNHGHGPEGRNIEINKFAKKHSKYLFLIHFNLLVISNMKMLSRAFGAGTLDVADNNDLNNKIHQWMQQDVVNNIGDSFLMNVVHKYSKKSSYIKNNTSRFTGLMEYLMILLYNTRNKVVHEGKHFREVDILYSEVISHIVHPFISSEISKLKLVEK